METCELVYLYNAHFNPIPLTLSFQLFKYYLGLVCPCKPCGFLGQLIQGIGNTNKILHKPTTIASQSQKLLQLLLRGRCRPSGHLHCFLEVCLSAISTDNVTQKVDLVPAEPTPFGLELQPSFFQLFKHCSQVIQMSLECLAWYHNVTNVDQARGPLQPSQHCNHEPLECGRGITKPEWHYMELK